MVYKIQAQALPDHKMYLSLFQTRSIFFELRSCGFSWLRDPVEDLYGQTNMTCDCIASPRTHKSDGTVFSIICCVPDILACCECVLYLRLKTPLCFLFILSVCWLPLSFYADKRKEQLVFFCLPKKLACYNIAAANCESHYHLHFWFVCFYKMYTF